MKKKIAITYEIDIPENTSEDVIEELAISLIPSVDAIDDYELLNDEVYDIARSRKDNIVINVEGYKTITIKNTEDFYDKHREEWNEKYGY